MGAFSTAFHSQPTDTATLSSLQTPHVSVDISFYVSPLYAMAQIAAGAFAVAGGALAAKFKLISFVKRPPFVRVHFRRMSVPVWPPKAVPIGEPLLQVIGMLHS